MTHVTQPTFVTHLTHDPWPIDPFPALPSGHHRTTLSGYIFATKAHIDNRKKMLSTNMSSTCPHNMVNFGLLAAEIGWPVWGTPANFNWFRVLAALLHAASSSGRQPNFAALNRGRYVYSAGRPSRWALAHISSSFRQYHQGTLPQCHLSTAATVTCHSLVKTEVRQLGRD